MEAYLVNIVAKLIFKFSCIYLFFFWIFNIFFQNFKPSESNTFLRFQILSVNREVAQYGDFLKLDSDSQKCQLHGGGSRL